MREVLLLLCAGFCGFESLGFWVFGKFGGLVDMEIGFP